MKSRIMETVLRTLRILQIAMLVSIALYVWIGERVAENVVRANPVFYYAITFVSISVVGVIFVVRRVLLSRFEAQLSTRPNDNALLGRWRAGYIVLYALCESIALFGFVLRVLGFPLARIWVFYLSGFALTLVFGPRQPKAEPGS